jgi:peptidoglycan/xylan/chitin deacetylase (PgdA/CDA1 family)
MRRGAVAVASLILMLGLAVGFYLGRRHSKAQLATPTTSSSLQSKLTPQAPSPPAGPHDPPVPILMYHVVGPTPPRAALPGLYVSRADFASQLQWLARTGYHAVTLDAVDRYWRGVARLPSRPIVLSFDDGYREQFTIAEPLLTSHHWPGVLDLEYAQLVHESLTGPMVRRMLADGWELDSHTMTHPDLTTVGATALRWELVRSRELLRRRFGVPVHFFCYPMGKFDARVVRAVRAAGYWGATTGNMGPRDRRRCSRWPGSVLTRETGHANSRQSSRKPASGCDAR